MDDKNVIDPVGAEDQREDLSFPLSWNTYASLIVFVIVLAVFAVPVLLFYGTDSFLDGLNDVVFDIRITLPVLAGGFILHELLHAAGFMLFSKTKFRQMKFGFSAETFTPYAHPRIPVGSSSYKIATLLPFLLMGIVPGIISLFTGSIFFLFCGVLYSVISGADIMVFWSVRKVNSSKLVVDHPEKAGCIVYENPFE